MTFTIITIVLALIIIVLLIWDLNILRKIYKESQLGNSTLSDEKYFELKYNINLVKAISAIGIFIIGFLGFSTYDGFKEEITTDLDKSINIQDSHIELINSKINSLNQTLDTLEVYKNNLEKLTISYQKNLQSINKKISSINNAARYNPRIYVVNNLKYSYKKNENGLRIYFKDLTTIFGEKLPIFSRKPYINTEGHNIDIEIQEVTKTYVDFSSGSALGYGIDEFDTYIFDIWIASFD